ncbi:hypothetical protein C8R42DRAFT_742020 [Lentinula raphanica]|nr:hypothetical protein C8R42DRAFT_742020 [Lentinula raphanica]
MAQTMPDSISDMTESLRTNYVGVASFTVLAWDHIITCSDEVEYVWKRPKGLITYLFLFNRYFTPLGFIVNLYAYLSPDWTIENVAYRCRHFIRYEGCTVAIAVEVVGIMMLIRIRAIYSGNKIITAILVGILLVETGVNAWLISGGEPCTMIFDPAVNSWASASAWIPLAYDTIVFALTMYRTVPDLRHRDASFIIKRIFEDGLIYYRQVPSNLSYAHLLTKTSVIFSVNAILTIMILAAPAGIKNIAAQSVAMMSRITINLKKAGQLEEARVGSLWNPNFALHMMDVPSTMTRDLQFATMEESTVTSTVP